MDEVDEMEDDLTEKDWKKKIKLFKTAAEVPQQNLDNSNADYSNSLLTRTKFLSLAQNFTESYPVNSNSLPTKTVYRFPSKFNLPQFYCKSCISMCIMILMFSLFYSSGKKELGGHTVCQVYTFPTSLPLFGWFCNVSGSYSHQETLKEPQ